jgi:dTDP-4-dehydrorhamnose reductase
MRILITGTSGFIGGVLARQLSKENEVIPFDRMSFDSLMSSKSSETVAADAIIHCAAVTSIDDCEKSPKDAFIINVYGSYLIARLAAKSNAKHGILLSSGAVYRPGNMLTETSELRPSSVYGVTKLLSEDAVLCQDVSFTVLRLFFPYGKESPEKQLMKRIINKIRNSEQITIQGEAGPTINPLHVNDLARAVSLALLAKRKGIFNLGGSEYIALRDLVSMIGKSLHRSAVINSTNGTPDDMNCDYSLFRNTFGFEPEVKLAQGIRELAGT